MPTENNPDISLLINGVNLISDCQSFNVKNAGVLKIPSATIILSNKNGKYTHGTDEIELYNPVIIDCDVRGITDRIFYGKVWIPEGKMSKTKNRSPLTLSCKAYPAQKLVRQTIKRNYADEGWRCKEAIEDLLKNPDSGEDTGITLITDNGEIIDTPFPEDMDKENLLDGIRCVAEKINYDGYFTGENWNQLYFKKVGTDAVNPTVHLEHPFSPIKFKVSIDEIKNYILTWGSTDQGYPTGDEWTEHGLLRYNPVAWSSSHPNIVLSDATDYFKNGQNSLKAYTEGGAYEGYAEFDITKANYKRPQDPTKNTMCFDDDRFTYVAFWFRHSLEATVYGACVQLLDASSRLATLLDSATLDKNRWLLYGRNGRNLFTVKSSEHEKWDTQSGFDWTNIKKIRIGVSDGEGFADMNINSAFWLDAFKIDASSWCIDPVRYPVYNPPVKDANPLYGYTMYNHEDHNIQCFEDAIGVGERILSVNKNPFKTVKATKGAKTWVKPYQYLQFTLPEYGIASEDWRIIEVDFDWETATKLLRSTMKLVPKLYGLPTSTARMDTRGGLLAELIK